MKDQAETLRKLMLARDAGAPARQARVLRFTSARRGAGTTSIVSRFGLLLSSWGLGVLLVDETPERKLSELFAEDGESAGSAARTGIDPLAKNLWIGASPDLAPAARPGGADIVLVDSRGNADGYTKVVENIVTLRADDESVAAAYFSVREALKTGKSGANRVGVIVNEVSGGREAQAAFQKLNQIASRKLDVRLSYLGHFPSDEKIARGVSEREILVNLGTGAPFVRCLELLAKRFCFERAAVRVQEEPIKAEGIEA